MSIKIPEKFASFKFIRPISWTEIFDEWRRGEEHQESWKKHWEERGYSSWDEWRQNCAAPLSPEKLEWFLYEVADPLETFPEIYGVPSHSWIEKIYGGEKTKKLKDIAHLPFVTNNNKVTAIKDNFPENTTLTGLIQKNNIILVEGMHRALALAGWKKETPPKSKITIALAAWPKKEITEIVSGYKK